MPDATYAIPTFFGGEISQTAQGRFDKPEYRVSLNVCLNSFPMEIGAWTRRPGSAYGGHSRGGLAARTIKFDFEQSNAVTLELTDGKMRFRNGTVLITTNDAVGVVAVSVANPAVVQTASAVTWATGDTAVFPGEITPLLENRQFLLTKIDTTHFSLRDALTNANIDGATLGAIAPGATIERVHELTTVYIGTSWQDVRTVQAEDTDVLLSPAYAPQILSVATQPGIGTNAQFEINPAVFLDGPYLDPLTNGVQVTPGAVSGLITLSLTFATYSATQAYAEGAFVVSGGINYVSLQDRNVNNTPAASPTFWAPTSAGAAINDGQGFLGTDVGRLVRLLSEPDLWQAASAYLTGAVVAFNPSGVPGASTYWQAKAGSTGKVPGADLTNWDIISSGAAQWTWGRITALSNIIDRALAGSTSIGDMTSSGGIAAPFDGVFSKSVGSSAVKVVTGGFLSPGDAVINTSFVGKNYTLATPQAIQQATIYPSTDFGFGLITMVIGGSDTGVLPIFTLRLRAKNTAPVSATDGTLLGSSTFSGSSVATTIISSDQTTTWNYVWVEINVQGTAPGFATSYQVYADIAQISFFSPTSSAAASAAATVEILGPPLLYVKPIVTWRLGVYSDTTGWPTCGTYHEGRIWLGGAVPNRFDAGVSNGIEGNRINFAPTNQYGVVAASNALSYVLNSDGVNKIHAMKPDLQGVVCFTKQGEWLVQAPTTGPIAPTNIAARRMTKNGSENVEPVRTENANLFVKRHSHKLLEYFADAYSGKFSAPNLADKAVHIVHDGIVELAYTDGMTPIVWGRDGSNALFGMTYRRTVISTQQGPDFYAWHRHELGSGRTVESICGGPSVGGDLDALTMVTNDDTGVRHVEVLTDTTDETTPIADAWHLDSSVSPTSRTVDPAPATGAPLGGVYFHGLWHLNGKTVQVFAGGLDCGDRGTGSTGFTDFAVANGQCFVPFGDGVSAGCGRGLFTETFLTTDPTIVIGFTYNSDGQIVRPISQADTGARNGPALGKTRRNHQFSALIANSTGVFFGSNFGASLRPAQFRQANGNALDPLTTYSGVHHDSLDDDYSYDGMIAWRVARPWPAHIIAISGNIQAQDR